MVKHIVIFKFSGNAEARKDAAEKFKAALEQLPSIIPHLLSIEVGLNNNPAEDYDLALTATADTFDDIKAYSVHPAHVAAVALVKPIIEKRACVDYDA